MDLKPQDSFHKGNLEINSFFKIHDGTPFLLLISVGWLGYREGEDPGFGKRKEAWVLLVLRHWKAPSEGI